VPSLVFGENRNVLGVDEADRSEFTPGEKLRVLGALGLKLGEGAWPVGGLNEGRDGLIWDDPPGRNDGGLEGVIGADLGALKDGLGELNDGPGELNERPGWLNDGPGELNERFGWPNDGPGWLEPMDGPDRPDPIDEPGPPENDPCMPDLSRPMIRLWAAGRTSIAATIVMTAARDWVFFCMNILLLLLSLPREPARPQRAVQPTTPP
jgi:hypothetical protein